MTPQLISIDALITCVKKSRIRLKPLEKADGSYAIGIDADLFIAALEDLKEPPYDLEKARVATYADGVRDAILRVVSACSATSLCGECEKAVRGIKELLPKD